MKYKNMEMPPLDIEPIQVAPTPLSEVRQHTRRSVSGAALALAMMVTPAVKAYAAEEPPSQPKVEDLVETVLPTKVVEQAPAPQAAATAPTADSKKRPFTIFVSPDGSVKNDGMSLKKPVRTLQQAQEIVKDEKPKTDVEVRIDGSKGPFMGQSVVWQNYVEGHSISFKPVNEERRPTFIGKGKQWFFLAKINPEKADAIDGKTNLRIEDLNIKKYAGFGVRLDGGITEKNSLVRPKTQGVNHNVIKDMHFSEMGSKYVRGEAYSPINLRNSSNNRIVFNKVKNIINNGSALSGLRAHAVYMADGSNNNLVAHNDIENISGAAIDVRNDSNDNKLVHNRVRNAGQAALINWFQEYAAPYECASHGNKFYYNKLGRERGGGPLRPVMLLIKNDQDYEGKHRACDNEGENRVYAKGNTYIRSERELDRD